jgi:hypothetical protein
MTQAYNLSQLANNVNAAGLLDASIGLNNAVPIANGGTGSSTANSARVALGVITSVTGSEVLPKGTVAQRDASPQSGFIRFNTEFNQFEGYNGTTWGAIGSGAQGGANNPVFFENDQTVTQSYTITTNKNAMSAGAITIDTGVTVTVPTNSTWTIV